MSSFQVWDHRKTQHSPGYATHRKTQAHSHRTQVSATIHDTSNQCTALYSTASNPSLLHISLVHALKIAYLIFSFIYCNCQTFQGLIPFHDVLCRYTTVHLNCVCDEEIWIKCDRITKYDAAEWENQTSSLILLNALPISVCKLQQ